MNLKVTPSIHVLVRRTRSTIIHAINKYSRSRENNDVVSLAKCKDCGNLIGRSNFDCLKQRKRLNALHSVKLILIVVIITLLFGYGLYLVRRYNQSFCYGSGGCQLNLLWPYLDCQVQI